jgi:hypothetical protein
LIGGVANWKLSGFMPDIAAPTRPSASLQEVNSASTGFMPGNPYGVDGEGAGYNDMLDATVEQLEAQLTSFTTANARVH